MRRNLAGERCYTLPISFDERLQLRKELLDWIQV